MALRCPAGLPEAYWLPVLASEAEARSRLLTTLDNIPWRHGGPQRFLAWDDVKRAVAAYIASAVGVFADQACLAVRARQLSPSKLDTMVEDFVETAMQQAYVGLEHEKILATWSSRASNIRQIRPAVMAAPWHARYLAQIPEIFNQLAEAVPAAFDPVSTKSAQRHVVVDPLLKAKGLSIPQWAERAGVNQAVAYDYLHGESDPRPANRKALAEALGVDADDLPN